MTDSTDVVVVGSCMIDLISYAPRLPKRGETLHGSRFAIGFGGKGCNQCVAARKLGASTLLVARLGDDSFGKDYLKQLSEYGIPTEHVRVTEEVSSGMAQITVSDSGDNQIVIVAGANGCLSKADVDSVADNISKCKVLVCQMEIPAECSLQALKIKAASGKGVSIFNVAPAQENLDPLFYSLPTIFCVNESEAELLTGMKVGSKEEAGEVAAFLLSKGCQQVIITLGDQGALFVSRDNPVPVHVAAEAVSPVDTTGAGDVFIGALAFYLAKEEQNMIEIINKACRVATMSVQKRGTQTSFPSYDELPVNLRC